MRINILRQSKGGGRIDGYILDVYGTWVTVRWMDMGHGLLLHGCIWDMGYCYMVSKFSIIDQIRKKKYGFQCDVSKRDVEQLKYLN